MNKRPDGPQACRKIYVALKKKKKQKKIPREFTHEKHNMNQKTNSFESNFKKSKIKPKVKIRGGAHMNVCK